MQKFTKEILSKKNPNKVTCSFKMDKNLKKAFSDLCIGTTGYSMYEIFNILAYEAMRHNGFKFQLIDENGFFPEEAEEIQRRIKNMQSMFSYIENNNKNNKKDNENKYEELPLAVGK